MASFAITKPTLKFCQSEKNIIKEESSIMDMPKPGFERANKPIIHSVFYKNPQNISNLSDSFKQAIPGLLNYKNTLKFEAAIKIQAVYRGLKAREKFKLLKVKPNIIFKAGKIIDEIPYQIHIIQNKSKCYLLISDSKNEVKFEISADIEPKKAVKMLAFDPHNGFYLKKSNEMDTNELIRQNTLLIDDESYEIKYYSNLFLDLIKLKLINNSTNRKFKCKKTKDFLNKSEMIQYINEKIEPNLRIINDRLVIYENNNEDINILCKGRVTSNDLDLEIKIYNRDEFFEINIDKLIKFISKTDIKSIESFKDDPNILLLYAQINLNDINFHITDTKLLHSSKQLLNDSNPYSVNIYQTDNLYLISTYEKSLPLISSIIISADEILEAFESKSLEACLKIIPENLKIESGQLHFDLKNEHLLNINRIKQVRNDEDYLMTSERMEAIMKSVVKIQKVYRGHRTRDILKFHYPKISLLQNTKLQIGANFFVFSIFKLFQGVLIEAYNEVDKKMFIKAIENPKDYIKNFNKYSDIKLLLVRVVDFEGNLAMLKSNASKHKVGVQDVDFFIQNTSTDTSDIKTNEKWPVFIKKKINSSPYIIQGSLTSIKSLHILIIPLFTGGKSYSKNYSEIDIIENCGKFDPRSLLNKVILDGEKIDIKGRKEIQSGNVLVYQTCKIFENKNYQVKVNLQSKNPGKAAIDDIMVFSIKDKSKHDETQILQIKLKKASKQTGINANMHMQIAIVLTKNLRLKNGIFLISFKPKKIDYIQATVKIQAIIRGFLSRRKFMKIYKKLLFEKFTLISGQRYKIKLFSIQDYYLIEAIKGGKSFLHRFISEISDPESFMESLDFYIEQVNGVKRLGGLQHLKYAKNKNGKKKLISTENKIISAENCELSIYDINSKMRYEVKIGENVLYLNFKKEIVNDIEEFTKMLEISDDKTELRHPMKDADAVLYSDSRFISNKLGKLFIFIKNSEYFASFFLVNESRSLILNLGASINADESIRKLRIVNDELTLIN